MQSEVGRDVVAARNVPLDARGRQLIMWFESQVSSPVSKIRTCRARPRDSGSLPASRRPHVFCFETECIEMLNARCGPAESWSSRAEIHERRSSWPTARPSLIMRPSGGGRGRGAATCLRRRADTFSRGGVFFWRDFGFEV